eukprot:3215383-Pleurochrysis_carterae.AAC.2
MKRCGCCAVCTGFAGGDRSVSSWSRMGSRSDAGQVGFCGTGGMRFEESTGETTGGFTKAGEPRISCGSVVDFDAP